MKENGIRAKMRKKYKATTDSRHSYPVAENLLAKGERQPTDTVWASDITYIPTDEGWPYLAGVMNVRYLKDNRVVDERAVNTRSYRGCVEARNCKG
jgi:putative transposase